MKFVCDKSIIVKEIAVAQEIISIRTSLSILSNVLLEADEDSLIIKASDLKVGFETRIPAIVEIPGNTTVFCDKFLNILRSLPDGEINFEQRENERFFIKPRDKKIVFELNCISGEKFPELRDINDDQFFDIPQGLFKSMICQTIFSISKDESRYYLNGVYLEKKDSSLMMTGSDGRRLSCIAIECENDIDDFPGIIIPPKVLHLVVKLSSGEGNLSLAITEKAIYLKFDNQRISSTLIEADYPNFSRAVPKSQDHNVIVNNFILREALRRVSLLAENESKRIIMTFTDGNLNLMSEESELGMANEDIPCDYTGDELRLAINYLYLQDPLKVINEESIIMEFSNASKAMVLRSHPEKNFYHVIMPMQLD